MRNKLKSCDPVGCILPSGQMETDIIYRSQPVSGQKLGKITIDRFEFLLPIELMFDLCNSFSLPPSLLTIILDNPPSASYIVSLVDCAVK